MDSGLHGKVVVISGGASGIGAAAAKAFLAQGCKVGVFGRDRTKLDSFSAMLKKEGMDIATGVADVRDTSSMQRFAEHVADKYNGIDVWINNAAIEYYAPLISCSEKHWEEVLDIVLTGTFRASKVAIPYLAKRSGSSIINLSSFCALMPTAKNGAYSIAKAGVNTLTQVLAAELAPMQIRVNCVVPGIIQTDMTSEQIERIEEMLLQPISMRSFGMPEDIAEGIVYLASDRSRYVNGHALVISGGKFIVQNPQDPWNNYMGGY